MKEGRFRLNIRKTFFYCEGFETLEQDAQRGCEFPNPGSVPGQVEQHFEQLSLTDGVPAMVGDWELDDLLGPIQQNPLYDSVFL